MEPAASPSGIEVFTLASDARSTPRRAGFIPVPGGPEALTIDSTRGTAYTHAGGDLVVIDIERRSVTARWPSGCRAAHGFPQIDNRHQLALASCASGGTVSLLSLKDGRQLGRYAASGGEALPAYSATTNHFYVRGDPGTSLVTLKASKAGLAKVGEVTVPSAGHCLTADDVGHYWTCDAERGRVLRFNVPQRQVNKSLQPVNRRSEPTERAAGSGKHLQTVRRHLTGATVQWRRGRGPGAQIRRITAPGGRLLPTERPDFASCRGQCKGQR
jgi:hypothetical protein